MKEQAIKLIKDYYNAFNRGDMPAFFDMMDDNIIHDINQGHRETGKVPFRKFMEHMNRCYKEHISNLVIFANDEGTRAAAEFIVDGTYLETDNGFAPANDQKYKVPVGAFFEIKAGKITRVTNYYNVKEWVRIISEQ